MNTVKPDCWYDYPLEDFGWVLRCGYNWAVEAGDEPTVDVVQIELVTRRDVPLALSDIPGVDLLRIEDAIREELLERLTREAEDLHELRKASWQEYQENRRTDA
jgi:hypothetical protein